MKRFWRDAALKPAGDGWQVSLDERAVKTRGGVPQIVPTEALGNLLRQEWDEQPEALDPASFPYRDLADRAIDTIAGEPTPVIERLVGFAETDTLCYRADPGEALAKRQDEVWEPLLEAFEQGESVALNRACGIMHKPQAPEVLEVLRTRLAQENPFTLAGLEAAASLSASLCIAMLALDATRDIDALWAAANLEEDFQAEHWGADEEASANRARKLAEFRRAVTFARAAR